MAVGGGDSGTFWRDVAPRVLLTQSEWGHELEGAGSTGHTGKIRTPGFLLHEK